MTNKLPKNAIKITKTYASVFTIFSPSVVLCGGEQDELSMLDICVAERKDWFLVKYDPKTKVDMVIHTLVNMTK